VVVRRARSVVTSHLSPLPSPDVLPELILPRVVDPYAPEPTAPWHAGFFTKPWKPEVKGPPVFVVGSTVGRLEYRPDDGEKRLNPSELALARHEKRRLAAAALKAASDAAKAARRDAGRAAQSGIPIDTDSEDDEKNK